MKLIVDKKRGGPQYRDVSDNNNEPKTKMTILPNHIKHQSGKSKTVCVTACLTSFGIDVSSFNYTGHLYDQTRVKILNRNGYSCRSRLSAVGGENTSIGKVREKIRQLNDRADTRYLVCMCYGDSCHAIVMDKNGETIVDTAPRKMDRRRVMTIHAVIDREGDPNKRALRRQSADNARFADEANRKWQR